MRVVGSASDADFRVKGDELLFGLANVRTPLKESRREACGNLGGVGLFGQVEATNNGAGVISKIGRASCRERV